MRYAISYAPFVLTLRSAVPCLVLIWRATSFSTDLADVTTFCGKDLAYAATSCGTNLLACAATSGGGFCCTDPAYTAVYLIANGGGTSGKGSSTRRLGACGA